MWWTWFLNLRKLKQHSDYSLHPDFSSEQACSIKKSLKQAVQVCINFIYYHAQIFRFCRKIIIIGIDDK